mmetsp:Transcript_20589/g.20957  ORF Transcript_20589/g.20957 Transcript_20589/m.20957 type:complete len:199 (-) Transcript_20589:520-1116(-)
MFSQGEIVNDNNDNSITRTIRSADERTSLVTSSPITSSSSLSVLLTDKSSSTTPHHHVHDPHRHHRQHPLPLVIAAALVIVASTASTTTYFDTRTNNNSRLRTNDNDNDNDPAITIVDVDGTVGTRTGTRVGIVHCCMDGQDYKNKYDEENCELDDQSGDCVGKDTTKPCGKDDTLYQTCCLKSNYESHQYQHFERCG